jgi:hypothetical protein
MVTTEDKNEILSNLLCYGIIPKMIEEVDFKKTKNFIADAPI